MALAKRLWNWEEKSSIFDVCFWKVVPVPVVCITRRFLFALVDHIWGHFCWLPISITIPPSLTLFPLCIPPVVHSITAHFFTYLTRRLLNEKKVFKRQILFCSFRALLFINKKRQRKNESTNKFPRNTRLCCVVR